MPRPRRRAAAAAAALSDVATPDADIESADAMDLDEQNQNNTEAQDDEIPPPPSEPSSPPVIEQIPRKRRPGRPPKNRPPDWDNTIPNSDPDATPVKRKRGRPSLGGRGGRGRGGTPSTPRVAIDKEGTMADVVNDEVQLPPDPEGETKVDENGNLLGGREYRVRVFTLLGRGDKLYMLSTEPARCVGYRDSYLFFSKNPRLFKITISDEEKRDLIERDLIPHSYKGRAIGVCTARSVFREYGSRIVVGGKRIIDDYEVAVARARGDVEGELADPHDELPKDGEPYNKNQYVAWHGASSVYHTNVPSVPLGGMKPVKRKPMTTENWQLEHVLANREFDRQLAARRKATFDGVYNIHTNQMLYPQSTQPTRCKWEQVEYDDQGNIISPVPGSTISSLYQSSTNDVPEPLTTLAGPFTHAPISESTDNLSTNGPEAHSSSTVRTNGNSITNGVVETKKEAILAPIAAAVRRNAMVVDVHYVTPPHTMSQGVISFHKGFRLRDTPQDVVELLEPDCRKQFEVAREVEDNYDRQWGLEGTDTHRRNPFYGFTMQ